MSIRPASAWFPQAQLCRLVLVLVFSVARLAATGASQPQISGAFLPQFSEFGYGFSIYPEIQRTKAEQLRLLDELQAAHVNTVRVFEAAWGVCEKEPGKYDFTWAREYLDEVQKRGMKAVIGTGSFILPQWLMAKHDDTLVQYADGSTAHPFGRRPHSMDSPRVREALQRYVFELAKALADHPAVIGWQIDNETDYRIFSQDLSPGGGK